MFSSQKPDGVCFVDESAKKLSFNIQILVTYLTKGYTVATLEL